MQEQAQLKDTELHSWLHETTSAENDFFQTTCNCNFALLHSNWQRTSRGAANHQGWLQGTAEFSVWSQGYLQDVLHTLRPSVGHPGKSAVEKDRVRGEASCRKKLRCHIQGPFTKQLNSTGTVNSWTQKAPCRIAPLINRRDYWHCRVTQVYLHSDAFLATQTLAGSLLTRSFSSGFFLWGHLRRTRTRSLPAYRQP
jgi:hypothetical protein